MNKLTVTKIEDREGQGICQHCNREGLRWIVILSDGSSVGFDCAKDLTGRRINGRNLNWIKAAIEMAHGTDGFEHFTLYFNGREGFLAVDGRLSWRGDFKGCMNEFNRRVS